MDKDAFGKNGQECLGRAGANGGETAPGGFEWYADKPMDRPGTGCERRVGRSGGAPDGGPPLDGYGLGGRENSGGALDIIWLVIGMAVVFAALGAAGFGLPAWALAGAAAFGIIAYVATRRQRGNELRRA